MNGWNEQSKAILGHNSRLFLHFDREAQGSLVCFVFCWCESRAKKKSRVRFPIMNNVFFYLEKVSSGETLIQSQELCQFVLGMSDNGRKLDMHVSRKPVTRFQFQQKIFRSWASQGVLLYLTNPMNKRTLDNRIS
jgi:hypothetical protein